MTIGCFTVGTSQVGAARICLVADPVADPIETPSKWARTCGVCEAWNKPFLCDLLRSTGRPNCIFGNIN